jgi:hypothetical protein
MIKIKYKKPLSHLTLHKLNWLEYVTIGLGLWFVIYPKPYTILFTILLCIPLLGLFLNGINGRPSIASLVSITKKNNGTNTYDVADFIDIATFAIIIRILIDYEVESFHSILIPGAVAFAIMLVILFTTHKIISRSAKSKIWIYLSLIFNILLYSYAGVYGINCVYDTSEPKIYKAEIIDKRTHRGSKGRISYYIKVTPWGHHYDTEELTVTNEKFNVLQIGQTINIDLREGLFNIPWYYIE